MRIAPLAWMVFFTLSGCRAPQPVEVGPEPYVAALRTQGEDPIEHVLEALDRADLILFDDGLHSAVEPFEFYDRLLRNETFRSRARFVFFEALLINHQGFIDDYLESDPEDLNLLAPVFQNDYNGTGWVLQTYLDLLRTIREINLDLPPDRRLRAVAVSNPVCWACIERPEDVTLMHKSLAGRDYLMYRTILSELDEFDSGAKGIFLTNTRHAYTGIKDRDGRFHWNTGTFFRQWHPGKSYSIRFHTVALKVERRKKPDPEALDTSAGMGSIEYRWIRMGDGVWDTAFRVYGDRPVAIALANNPFGREPYVGNHMADMEPGQTMADAYDALIFLEPLESLEMSGKFDFIFTADFREEVQRRYRAMYSVDQIREKLESEEVESLEQWVDVLSEPSGPRRVLDVLPVGSIDAWRE